MNLNAMEIDIKKIKDHMDKIFLILNSLTLIKEKQ